MQTSSRNVIGQTNTERGRSDNILLSDDLWITEKHVFKIYSVMSVELVRSVTRRAVTWN